MTLLRSRESKAEALRKRLDDEVDVLRLALMAATRVHDARSVCLVGQSRGAGTTTLALRLARSMARESRPTLLVDGTFSDPRLHELLHVPLAPGIVDLLDQTAGGQPPTHRTSEPHLEILTSGADHDGAGRATVERWQALLASLAAHRFVVIDGGSVDSPSALTLAAASDGVALVIESGENRRQDVESTLRQMSLSGAKLLGIVLNKERHFIPDFVDQRL